jgi:hypothetical protein
MKQYTLFLFLLIVCLTLCCTSSSNSTDPSQPTFPIQVSIHINGSDTLLYSGSYGNSTDTSYAQGTIPIGSSNYAEYSATVENDSDMVFAGFQKQQEYGELKVSIYVDFDQKAERHTSQSYGSVYVTWQPE